MLPAAGVKEIPNFFPPGRAWWFRGLLAGMETAKQERDFAEDPASSGQGEHRVAMLLKKPALFPDDSRVDHPVVQSPLLIIESGHDKTDAQNKTTDNLANVPGKRF